MVSPQLRAGWRRFRAQRRAWWSFLVILVLFLLSLPAELLCNDHPLLIHFSGRFYFPVFKRYTEADFGGKRSIPPDYHSRRFAQLVGLLPAVERDFASDRHAFLAQFDDEPGTRRPRHDWRHDPWSILHSFDPEPWDVPLARSPERPPSPVAASAWILWPPIRYDYAYIARGSRSGRDALASPWGKTVASSATVYRSSWLDGHYLGTDDRGRDVLARLIYGFRVSMVFGILLALSGTLIGSFLGSLQGFFGGIADLFGQRLTEIWGSLPQLYLLMILSSFLVRNIHVLFFILNLTSWMGMAAYMRAEFLRGRQLEYVTAARGLGVSNLAIMFRHILPNSLTPIITFFPFSVSGGILALVSLDFLNLGVPSPYPSLGELLAQGQANLQALWIILPTFIVLSGTITLLTFVGDGLRNAFDPRKTARTRVDAGSVLR